MKEFGTAVILAGGKSTRMGFDKQFLWIKERRLIDSIRKKLAREFDEIIVVTNKTQYYLWFTDKIIEDKIPNKGPLSGIHAGLVEASSKFVYFIACDMPNINLGYIRFMKGKLKHRDAVACITKYGQWIEPFNAFYSREMIGDIERHLMEDRRSVNSLIKKLPICYIQEEEARTFSPHWDMFLNLNTRKDLEDYLESIND